MEYSREHIYLTNQPERKRLVDLVPLHTIAPGESASCTFGDVAVSVTATALSDAPESLGTFVQHGRFYTVESEAGEEIMYGQYIVELTDIQRVQSGSVHVSEKEIPLCRVSIEKVKQYKNADAYKGLGLSLYTALLDDLKHIAKTLQKPLRHVVKHVEDAGLSTQQWSAVFDALLQQRGYVKNADNQWEKIYTPV